MRSLFRLSSSHRIRSPLTGHKYSHVPEPNFAQCRADVGWVVIFSPEFHEMTRSSLGLDRDDSDDHYVQARK